MLAAALAALALASPVSGSAWRGVVNDWLGGNRFDRPHTCAAVVVAWGHVVTMSYPQSYSSFPTDLRLEARRVCGRGAAARVRLGMSDTEVGRVAGLPSLPLSGPRCWTYPTRRVCFAHGRVSRIRLAARG